MTSRKACGAMGVPVHYQALRGCSRSYVLRKARSVTSSVVVIGLVLALRWVDESFVMNWLVFAVL